MNDTPIEYALSVFEGEQKKTFLKNLLRTNICKIVFIKNNGSERTMFASLLPKFVEPIKPLEKPVKNDEILKEPKPDNPNLLSVVDTEINSWRSVKIDSIISFETDF